MLNEENYQPSEEELTHAIHRFSTVLNKGAISDRQKKKRKLLVMTGVAACLLSLIGISFFFKFIPENNEALSSTTISDGLDISQMDKTIVPGREQAILKSSNGSIIELDILQSGKIEKVTNQIHVVKSEEGFVSYETASSPAQGSAFHYNEIVTPVGGQFQIVLPDGTKIWLNASTTMRIPSNFSSQSRMVELTGEAYFEVKKDPSHPFLVKTTNQTIEVYGTNFNIYAYADEPNSRTTLLEGTVKVTKTKGQYNGEQKILKPGQVAVVKNDFSEHISIHRDDSQNAISWKKGYFNFENTSLRNLMRQLERWYNIKTVFEGSIMEHAYVGQIERKSDLIEVLKILELSGLKINVVDRTVYVKESMPMD